MLEEALNLLQQCADGETAQSLNLQLAYLNPGASFARIEEASARSLSELGLAIPDDLVTLLRVSDAVQVDNIYLHNTPDLIDLTLDRDYRGVLLVGSDGPSDLIFDPGDEGYHFVNIGDPNERFESFPSLEALLMRMLRP